MRTRMLIAAVLALVANACAPVLVNSYRQRDADFTRYRTYTWATTTELATGDARLDNNPFVDRATRQAIDRVLAGRGLAESREAPHVMLRYHLSITQRLDLAGTGSTYLICEECAPSVYDAGTLVIDILDADTSTLLWRGWAEGSFDRLIDDQQALEQRINEVVAKIMTRCPLA